MYDMNYTQQRILQEQRRRSHGLFVDVAEPQNSNTVGARLSALEKVDVKSDEDVKGLVERVSALEELTTTLVVGINELVKVVGDSNVNVLNLAKEGLERVAELTNVGERVSALEDVAQTLITVSKQLVSGADDTKQHVLELTKAGWELSATLSKVDGKATVTDSVLRSLLQALPDPMLPNSIYSFPDESTVPAKLPILTFPTGSTESVFLWLPPFPEIEGPDYGAFFDNFLFDLITEAYESGLFDETYAYNVWSMVLGTMPTDSVEAVVSPEMLDEAYAITAEWQSVGKPTVMTHHANLTSGHANFLTGMIAAMVDAVSAEQVGKQIDDMFALVFAPNELLVNLNFRH